MLHQTLGGKKVFIVAYSILYGAAAIPSSKVVIEGIAESSAGRYEAVATTGEFLDDSFVKLELAPSPRADRIWLLAHGQQAIVMQYTEKICLYAFDGSGFELLWSTAPKLAPSFQIGPDWVQFSYNTPPEIKGPRLVQRLYLRAAGILESPPGEWQAVVP